MIRIIFKDKILKLLHGNKNNFLILSMIYTLGDILFLKKFYFFVSLFILLNWFLVIYLFKFTVKKIALIIVLLFILISFFHILSLWAITEKAAIWAYLFLIIYLYFLIKLDRNPKNKNPD